MFLVPSLLFLAALTPAQLPSETRYRVEVTPAGPELVVEARDAAGLVHRLDAGHGARTVTAPRWRQDDNGLAWIADAVAAGDNGAVVIAGKGLNNEGVTVYHAVDPQPIFDFSTLGSEYPVVALADRAPLAAALVVTDRDPGSAYDFEGVVDVWSTTGNGTPAWTYTFPRTVNYFGGGVTISDDGSIVLAWKADPISGTLLVRTFDGAGNLLASGALSVGTSFHSRQTRLSDDGTRAYFNIGAYAVIYDVLAGVEEYRHNIGASFDAHDLSGDGRRFAYGQFGYFRVYEETAPGVWSQIVHRSFSGSTYVGVVALNGDGSRCAFLNQRYAPAMDHFEVGVHDVVANSGIFLANWDAPGTAYQLSGRACRLDDAGDYAAFCSWGDSLNAVPEGLVYEVATGTLSASLDSPGSANMIDLDADGDVMVMGTKAVHANTFGNGGSVFAMDAFDQDLHVLGWPQVGGAVSLTVPGGPAQAIFSACRALGATPTPLGVAEIDVNTELWRSPTLAVPPGGLNLAVSVPPNPALAGMAVHLQGALLGPGYGRLTNKVSLRLQP